MARTDKRIILRERTNNLNLHTQKLLKPASKSRFRGTIFTRFKNFEVEDEFSDTLKKEELLDHDNCMWLSSGDSSPSSCLQNDRLFGYMDLKIDAWFISLLSKSSQKSSPLLNTEITFFDGSRVNPIEESSLVLDQRKISDENLVFQESLKEEEVVSWLVSDSDSEVANFESDFTTPDTKSYSISSITDSSDEHSLFSSSSTSDYYSDVVDLEEIGSDKPLFWPSEWASEWTSESGSEAKWDLLIMSPRKNIHSVDNSLKTSTSEWEFVSCGETTTKTPVFWPTNSTSEWDSDTKWDLFIMSPQKDIYKVSSSPKTSPDTLRFQVLNRKRDLPKSCSRKLEFTSESKSSPEVKKTTTEVNGLTKKPVTKNKIVLEDLLLVDKLNSEGAIEEVLGLGEFDGHEGVESEFNKNEFSFVEIND